MELFKLLGRIIIENSEANGAIDETTEKAETAGSKLASGISTAAKWGTAIVGGATVAADAMIKFAESSASTADNIDKMSQKIGISREAYQELDFICSQSGTSVDTLQAGMKTLTAAMDKAASGTAANVEQFEALGISVTDANGNLRSHEDVMWEAMEALQGIENQTEKARLATELFGKSGTELMPLLNGASGSIDEMKQQAHDLGLVMGDEMIDSGVELTDTIDQTKRAFKAIVTQLGGSLMPIVTQFLKVVQQGLPFIQQIIEQLSPLMQNLFESIMPPLMEIMETIFPVLIELIQKLLPPIMELVTIALNLIMSVLQPLIDVSMMLIDSVLKVVQPILDVLVNTLGTVLTPIIEALSPIFEAITTALQPLFDLFGLLISEILKPIMPILTTLAEVFSVVLGGAIQALMPIIEGIMDIFSGLIKFITGVFSGNWEQAWEGIVDVFKGLFNLIPSIAEGIVNGAIAIINGIITGINGITGKIGIPSIPLIPDVSLPRLEQGGILEKGQVGLLEGNGAEAVVPLENNKKWISKVAADMQSQGICGDPESMKSLIDIMQNILAAIQGLNASEIIQVVPDESGIFEIVKKQSRKNAALGKPGIVV